MHIIIAKMNFMADIGFEVNDSLNKLRFSKWIVPNSFKLQIT